MSEEAAKRKPKHSGSETRQRQERFSVRCTELQRRAIQNAAQGSGMSVSSYVLRATLKAEMPRAVKVPPVQLAVLAQVLAQLGRLNGNLYQIVRAINFNNSPDLRELRELPEVIRELRGEVLRAMGKRGAKDDAGRSP